VQKLVQF